ncbi:DUF5412 family protein [Wenyingzhuangia sp. IMCC45574]
MKKKILSKVLLGVFIISIIGMFIFLIVIASLFSSENMCEQSIVEIKVSPNKLKKAIILEKNCGATSGLSTQLHVLNINENINEKYNPFFSADSDHGKAEITEENIININIDWSDNETLVVEYDKKARVFIKEKAQNEVVVEYKTLANKELR